MTIRKRKQVVDYRKLQNVHETLEEIYSTGNIRVQRYIGLICALIAVYFCYAKMI